MTDCRNEPNGVRMDLNGAGSHAVLRNALLALVFSLAACSSEPADDGLGYYDPQAGKLACIERGIAYFKETGSYPTLSSAPNTGRAAEDVAKERCERAPTAF